LTVAITATSISNGNVSAVANLAVPGVAVSVSPGSATVNTGSSSQLTAMVTNDASNQGVTWTLSYTVNGSLVPCPSAAVCGSVSPASTASGLPTTYAAPSTPPAGNLEVALTATSVANTAASAQAFVTIPGINILIDPNSAIVEAGGSKQFTASVSNDPTNQGVTWAVLCAPSPCGTISPVATASGTPTTYNAPPTPPTSDLTVSITATSVLNSLASNSATVTVPAIVVAVNPISALLPLNIAQQFSATVSNDPTGKGVTWTAIQAGAACSPGCGSVAPSSTGSGSPTTYNAPATLPTNAVVELTAMSAEDATKSASSTITLSNGNVELVPDSLLFRGVLVNSHSKPLSVILTNTGSSALAITSMTISGTDPNDFSQTNTCSTSVPAGNSCTITVTFTPKTMGTRKATLSITDSSTDSPQQVSLSGNGFTRRPPLNKLAARWALAHSATATVPAPTGLAKVGTRVIKLVDSGRRDPYLSTGANRQMLVRFWFPTSLREPCRLAAYTSPGVWSYFSQLLSSPLPRVATNSCWEAPVGVGKHPVVVFTPGYTATFTDYTFLFEQLASRGYVVASVDHTYEATAVEFPDGAMVKSVFGSHLGGKLRGDDRALSFANSVRLADLKFVANELRLLNSQPDGPFAGRLDLTRMAVAGHSMGGATAFLELLQDARFKAGIMIDSHLPEEMIQKTHTPVMILAMGVDHWTSDQCQLWSNLRGPRVAVNLKGAEHVTPSDAIWLAKYAIQTGPMGPDKTIAAIRDYIGAFLDTNLRQSPLNPLLAGPSSDYPDASVTTQQQRLCR